MRHELTAEQQHLQDTAASFARLSLESDMLTRDRDGLFDREAWQRCAEFGVLNMPIPQEYGGLGLGLTDLLAVMEGLGRGTRDHGLLFSLNAHLWTNSIPILKFGNEEQRRKYLAAARRRHAHRRERGLRAGFRVRHLQHAHAGDCGTATTTY